MYTLENNDEASAHINKPDVSSKAPVTLPAEGPQRDGAPDTATVHDPISVNTDDNASLPATNNIEKLPSPDKGNAGNKKMALAALTIACIAVFFTALDQTVVVTALPQIITDLQIPVTQLDHAAWIVSAYLLGFIVVMPLMGRVSDIYGRRRIFLLCLIIFGIGSLACACAPFLGKMYNFAFLRGIGVDTSNPGLMWLIGARLFQAIGGGAVVPVAMAIASDFYGQERRGVALGIIGGVTEAGGALGPLYGALIVGRLGWQWIFYLNIPLVILLMIAAWVLIPRSRRLYERIDWIGALLLGLALTCLSMGLAQQGAEMGPPSTSGPAPQNNPIALALALIFLVAFVLVERKRRWPVVNLTLFKRFPFSATSLVSLLVGAALIVALADIPIYVDTVLQRPVLDSGLALLRLTAMIPLGALLGGWLCERITCRMTGIIGLLFTAAGFYMMSLWPIRVDWTQMTISTLTAGFGFGLVIAPIGTTAINAVSARQAGMSSSVVTALRMLGMTLGLAALTSWALAYFRQLAAAYPSLPVSASVDQFTRWQKGYAQHLIQSAHTVYTSVFFAAMCLCLVAIVPSLFLWGRQAAVAEVEEEPETDAVIYDMPTGPLAVGAAALVTRFGVVPNVLNRWKWWRNLKPRQRIIAVGSSVLALLIIGLVLATVFLPDEITYVDEDAGGSAMAATNPIATNGSRDFQFALDRAALTSIFATQLGQQTVLSDMSVTPLAGNGLALSLSLRLDTQGIHRVMPIEIDGTVGLDQHGNMQLSIQHFKRDGTDAGPDVVARMQTAMNQMLSSVIMPKLRTQFKNAQLVEVYTSNTIACSNGTEMFVLHVKAPPVPGLPAQQKPTTLCINGSADLNKLMPH